MRVILLLSFFVWAPCQLLYGDTVVSWGGNYVGTSQPLNGNAFIGNGVDADGDAANDDEISGRAFDTDINNPFSPISGYSGTSGRFFGGAILTRRDYSGGDTAFDEFEVKNQGPNDSVHMHASHANHQHNLRAAFLWQQADFLTGNTPMTFNSSSFATFSIGSSATENLVGAQVRLLVRDSMNNYWLSQTAMTSPGANDSFTWNSGNQGFSNSSDGFWASFDPFASLGGLGAGTDLRFDQGAATFSDMKFSGITGVGIFFEQDTFHNNLDFHWEGFEVNAVPEPSSVSLILGVGAAIATCFRRRKA